LRRVPIAMPEADGPVRACPLCGHARLPPSTIVCDTRPHATRRRHHRLFRLLSGAQGRAGGRLSRCCGFYGQRGVEKVDAEELWARADVLTIHLSRNSTTVGMYTAEVLDRRKPGAVLIDCARGGIVDEAALKARLESGHIAGAAFDVFAVEPANGNPLLDAPNFLGSPHIGATTRESWSAMLRSGMHGIEHAYEPQPGVYPFD
jgi:lactate dehydrogenase-like 2-hydroxyacid dehydrogenase